MKLNSPYNQLKYFSFSLFLFFISTDKSLSEHLNKANKSKLDFIHSYRVYNVPEKMGKLEVKPINQVYKFKYKRQTNDAIKEEINKSSILTYLVYEKDQIITDEYNNKFINSDTRLPSHSMAKSMVSYVLAHAVCRGFIKDLNKQINDYYMLSNTLYFGQKISDLIDMRAGDQDYSTAKSSEFYNKLLLQKNKSFKINLKEDYLNTIKSKNIKYNYNHMPPDIILNYIDYKSNGNIQKILNKTFQKAQIKNSVFFIKDKDGFGVGTAWFYASRYDYLRIAKAILDDWKNDTCEGRYLKKIYKLRKKKSNKWNPKKIQYSASSYGGFFHFDQKGLEKKKILAMHGHGGQRILIDFENEKIISIQSIRMDYDYKKLVLDPFK